MSDDLARESENTPEPTPKQRGSFIISVKYACSGLAYAWRTERNIRIQSVCAIGVLLISWAVQISRIEWVLIVLACGLVLAAELVNTAVERVVDLCSPENHPLAKAAKDVAAGMVLLLALTAVVIGVLILGPPLLRLGMQG